MTFQEKAQRNQLLLKDLETMSQKEVGIKYNLSTAQIGNIYRKNGIKLSKSRLNMSKLKLDIDFFKEIDTPQKAYWLGFIAADGSINKSNGKLTLISHDEEVITKFKKHINSEHIISHKFVHDKRTNKNYERYTIQITNALFVNNLIKQGITNQKTDYFLFPKIKEKYYGYFIAGLFDGDGSIRLLKNKTISINLISTKETLDFILDFLYKNFNVKKPPLYKVTKNKQNVYKFFLYKNAIIFLDFIYGDKNLSDMFLQRKYKIYIENKHNKASRNKIQKVLQYSLDGYFIKKFNSLKEAANSINSHNGAISSSVKHRNGICKGYKWIYYTEGDIIKEKI